VTVSFSDVNDHIVRTPNGSSDLSHADLAFARIARSAAHASGCRAAVLCQAKGPDDYAVSASFGAGDNDIVGLVRRALRLPAVWGDDATAIIDDLTTESVNPTRAGVPHIGGLPVVFLAVFRAASKVGDPDSVLVIADTAAHSGLSAATIFVLRTHAAQIVALLELHTLRSGQSARHKTSVLSSSTERLRLLESVVVNANDAVLITEAEPISEPGPRIVYCNAAFTRTTGYQEAEILGRTPRILQSSKTDRATLDRLRAALSRWEPVEVELLNVRKDGREFWVELSIVPVANEEGWFTHWVSVQRDINHRKESEEIATRARIAEAENRILEAELLERKRVEAKLLYTAFHDDLTGLRNRAYLMDRLTLALSRDRSDEKPRCAVLFMDLDRFKLVNDSLGHRAGDVLLVEVSKRLGRCIRPQDTLARLGGDEFALLVEGIDSPNAVVNLAERIIASMRQPLWIGKQEVFTSCSIGVVYGTTQYAVPEEILRDADIAMYQAKRHNTGGYAVFASTMHDGLVEAFELRTDLQNALQRGEFHLVYQPIWQTSTGTIIGIEALIRWQHPTRGLVLPSSFIPILEDMGSIRSIGRWVLREACNQMCIWEERFPGMQLRLSVNTSSEELKDRRFVSNVRDTLGATGFDPKLLQLEITESVFIQHPEAISEILKSIRALGVRIALDDFGTGYSSLSYLDRYQMDTIKIDRSFVTRMLDEPRTKAIIGTIVALGRVLDLDIVAEGVEEATQWQELQNVGCASVQGYLLSRPLPAEALEGLLARQRPMVPGDSGERDTIYSNPSAPCMSG
jgi:diguanylate cyclase (GGDEF)-like protein/PAS domain S-box-containing protein